MLAVVYNDYCRTGHGMLEPAYGANLFIYWWLFSLVQVCGQKAVTYFRRKKFRSWTNSFKHLLPMLYPKKAEESHNGVSSPTSNHVNPTVIIEHTDSMDAENCNCIVCAANSEEDVTHSYSSSCSSCSSSSTDSSSSFSEDEDNGEEEIYKIETDVKEKMEEENEEMKVNGKRDEEIDEKCKIEVYREECKVVEENEDEIDDEEVTLTEGVDIRDEKEDDDEVTLKEGVKIEEEKKEDREMIIEEVKIKEEKKEDREMIIEEVKIKVEKAMVEEVETENKEKKMVIEEVKMKKEEIVEPVKTLNGEKKDEKRIIMEEVKPKEEKMVQGVKTENEWKEMIIEEVQTEKEGTMVEGVKTKDNKENRERKNVMIEEVKSKEEKMVEEVEDHKEEEIVLNGINIESLGEEIVKRETQDDIMMHGLRNSHDEKVEEVEEKHKEEEIVLNGINIEYPEEEIVKRETKDYIMVNGLRNSHDEKVEEGIEKMTIIKRIGEEENVKKEAETQEVKTEVNGEVKEEEENMKNTKKTEEVKKEVEKAKGDGLLRARLIELVRADVKRGDEVKNCLKEEGENGKNILITNQNDKTFQEVETFQKITEIVKMEEKARRVREIKPEVRNGGKTDKIKREFRNKFEEEFRNKFEDEFRSKFEERSDKLKEDIKAEITEEDMKIKQKNAIMSRTKEEGTILSTYLTPDISKMSAYSQFSKLPVPPPNSPKRTSRVRDLATWFEEKVIVRSDPVSENKMNLQPEQPVICKETYDSNNNKRVVGELVNFFCHKEPPRPRPQPISEGRVNVMNLIETFERRVENHISRHYPFIPLHSEDFV